MILKAPVDLLWSGGIGTYVKGESETNADVGDRANDATRVNASQLRCKVVGEGGNLGMTQLARVEYTLNGGACYTDFIDNSAGVNCSDKEVNIKILLNGIVANGDLTEKQRNELLVEMTDDVARLVLSDNYAQPRAIDVMASQSLRNLELHGRYISELQRTGKLDRRRECLPDEKTLIERKLNGKGLGRPSVAILSAYSKIILKEDLLASDVPEDSHFKTILPTAFPAILQKKYAKQMQNHPLKREIIATKLSNIVVNEMGFSFIFRMQDETGASVPAIVRAYMIARTVLDLDSIWKQIEAQDAIINAETGIDIMMLYVRLIRRITRWFLRTQRMHLDMTKTVARYASGVQELKSAMPKIYTGTHRAFYDTQYKTYLDLGIPAELAHELTITRALFSAMDIIEVAHERNLSVTQVAETYFGLGAYLDLTWIRSQVIAHPTENHWESLSREALRDDLDWQQRQLTMGILSQSLSTKDNANLVDSWSKTHIALLDRWRHILADLRSSPVLNYTMFFVAIRELLDLTQATMQMSEKVFHNEKGTTVVTTE
jgi:glutamate dehydrogenase